MALVAQTITYTGTITAYGGAAEYNGGPGTIYQEASGTTYFPSLVPPLFLRITSSLSSLLTVCVAPSPLTPIT